MTQNPKYSDMITREEAASEYRRLHHQLVERVGSSLGYTPEEAISETLRIAVEMHREHFGPGATYEVMVAMCRAGIQEASEELAAPRH